jgi:hypothetical protein
MMLHKLFSMAKGMPHVVAFATTVAFAVPVGAFIAHQQLSLEAAKERQTERHATLHAQMIEEAIDRSVVSTQLLADALQDPPARQLLSIGQNIIRLSGTISHASISPVGGKAILVIRDHAQRLEPVIENPLVYPGRRVALSGMPVLAANAEELTISQGIEIYDRIQARLKGTGEPLPGDARKPAIYVAGVILNQVEFVYAILAQPFGPPALFTSMR